MGLEKSEKMLAALFQAYLHMFFSMQNASVYNLIVVGVVFFLPLLIHMQMTHTCSCAVLIICVLLSVCPAGSGSKGEEEGIHSFNLQENSLMQTEVRQQTTHQGCD